MGLQNKRHQQARAFKMLEKRIVEGKTLKEVAKDFNVSVPTVHRAMSLAKKGDLLITFEDKLHAELIPLAHTAIVGALHEGNAKVALEIFKGTNLLKKNAMPTLSEQQDADDLAAYILSKRTAALLEETSIDVTPDAHPAAALAPAAARPDAPGDSAPDTAERRPEGRTTGRRPDGPSL